jgi:hypothetical protein
MKAPFSVSNVSITKENCDTQMLSVFMAGVIMPSVVLMNAVITLKIYFFVPP